MVGGIIWVFVRLIGTARLPAIIRAIIGASFILILLCLRQLLRSEVNSGLIPPTPMEAVINVLMYIVSFGALPGIAARPAILDDETRTPTAPSNKALQLTAR